MRYDRKYIVFRICCGFFSIALLCAMWFFSSQNGEESGKISGSIARFILRLISVEESSYNLARVGYIVRKAAHFSLFALFGLTLGFAIAPSNRPIRAFWGLSIAIISAILDEYHQTFIANRSGMWQDSLLDTCGAITGAAIAFLVLRLKAQPKAQRSARTS